MLVKLLASRGAGGQPGDVVEVTMAEAESLFRKGKAIVYREGPKPERATRRKKSEKASR